MRCSLSEERLSNEELLKTMMAERSADTFCNKVIDEFVKKKQRIE